VVPQAAGGTNDIVARMVAPAFGEAIGASVVVENRPGAGVNIGTQGVARAAKDGYTLLLTINSAQAINPALYKNPGFDPINDFVPLYYIGATPYVLVTPPGSPYKTLADVEQVNALLDEKVKASYYGKKLAELQQQLSSTTEGSMAPDFTLNDVNNQPISLSSFKGKVTLIDFWASWCGPCRAENPNVVAAYNKFHAKGFEILGVSLDDQKEKWIQAISKDKLTWTHVSDLQGRQSEVATKYGIQSIPSNFLIDASGKIIAINLRGEDLEKKLLEIFK
jgi:peroxiredoxin